MKFTYTQFKKIINGEVIGEEYPFSTGSHELVEEKIKEIISEIIKTTALDLIVDLDSYGSGSASYIDIFCFKSDGSSTGKIDGSESGFEDEVHGITLYMCLYAPVAVCGEGRSFLGIDSIGEVPKLGNWDEDLQKINDILLAHRISLLSKDYLSTVSDFDKIPTILAQRPYTIFDNLFHWQD